MGLFTCKKLPFPKKPKGKDKNTVQKVFKERRQTSLSFFKVISLGLDYLIRINTNSLRVFLERIYVDNTYFSTLEKNFIKGKRLFSH